MISIANQQIGSGQPCFIIAEAGVNHNGSLDLARRLVDAAIDAGANAVKFQTFTAEAMVSPQAPKADYQLQTTDSAESQFEMIRRLELSPDMHRQLIAYCQERGILFMSSPFDESSADLLSELGVAVYKIPSGELTNLPLLDHVARKGKPMIVSTGMAYLSEVETAVGTITEAGNKEIILLHCVSNYPAHPADINLSAMATMARAFDAPVGYSDHTTGIEVTLAAVAMGARVIEKHLTLDRDLPGPDHLASIEPGEFMTMVRGIRNVEAAIGHGRKEPAASESGTADVARKSLVAGTDIPADTVLTEDMIAVMRPGTGFPPAMRSQIAGRRTKTLIASGTLIIPEMLA